MSSILKHQILVFGFQYICLICCEFLRRIIRIALLKHLRSQQFRLYFLKKYKLNLFEKVNDIWFLFYAGFAFERAIFHHRNQLNNIFFFKKNKHN